MKEIFSDLFIYCVCYAAYCFLSVRMKSSNNSKRVFVIVLFTTRIVLILTGTHTYLVSFPSNPRLSLLTLFLQGLGHDTGDEVSGYLSKSGAHRTWLSLNHIVDISELS